MIIYSAASYGQEENKFSIGLDANYLHHYLDRDTKNNFNYGFSFLMSEKIAKIKISFGLNFSTLNYNYIVKPSDNAALYLRKEEYKVQYLNFPLLVFFNINSIRLTNINPFVGIIGNKVINYDVVSYYLNTPPVYKNDIDIIQNIGFTFRAGANVSKTINKHFTLNTALFSDCKFVKNGVSSSHGSENIPDPGISIGFKIGFDYNL